MTDPKIRKKGKVTSSSVKKQNEKGIVRSTFERAFQIRGENVSPKSAKLSGASQINRFFRNYLIYILNRVLVISSDA